MRFGRVCRTVTLLLLLSLDPMNGHADQARNFTPNLNDFAYGIPLEIVGDGAMYEVALPPELYKGVLRNDLGDACVFNGQGEIVPFALQKLTAEPPKPSPAVPLSFFPIYGQPGEKPEGLSLHIRRDTSGAIMDLDASAPDAQERKVVAYLLDANSLHQPVSGLVLEWQTIPEGFVARVSVEHSNDLDHWSSSVTRATIASLRYEEHSLEQRKIDLGRPLRAKYLRLSWPQSLEEVQLKGIAAQLAQETPEQERQWATIEVKANADRAGEYSFDAPGSMPVDRVRLKFPQKNTMAWASFFSRTTDKDGWRSRNLQGNAALVYSLRIEGEDFPNPDIPVIALTDRLWMMRIHPAGGIGQGMLQIELGWVPQQLVFVARGEPPFRLAYGSARVMERNFQVDDLLTKFADRHKNKLFIKAARTGPQMTLGGQAVLKPLPPPYPWKEWLLWLVLVSGVLLLAWMTLRLYRQMNPRDNGNTDKNA